MAGAAVSRVRVALTLCGAMNPVTHMHLRTFELARDSLHATGKYTVERGIISPVHDGYGKKGLAPAHHRIAMCKLAVQTSDWLQVDTWEMEQPAWLPTKLALDHLKEAVGDPALKVQLLCGADLLESFGTPGLWAPQDIKDIVTDGIVVISRFGFDAEKFIYESDVLNSLKSSIHMVTEWIPNDVSSTKIRRSLRRGESIKYLIPDPVIEYIQEHKLYQEADV